MPNLQTGLVPGCVGPGGGLEGFCGSSKVQPALGVAFFLYKNRVRMFADHPVDVIVIQILQRSAARISDRDFESDILDAVRRLEFACLDLGAGGK